MEYSVVDVPPPPATASWQKSSASGGDGGACVEVARTHEHVWVRDSKSPRGPALGFTHDEWAVFLVVVQRGEFDSPGVSA
jgi:hypothetical protein